MNKIIVKLVYVVTISHLQQVVPVARLFRHVHLVWMQITVWTVVSDFIYQRQTISAINALKKCLGAKIV